MVEENKPSPEDEESTEESYLESDNLFNNIQLGCIIVLLLLFVALGPLISLVSNLLGWLVTDRLSTLGC
ncbi:hypothetical protein ACFL2Q_08125 [Thermodesulfobacteriota bacterium]